MAVQVNMFKLVYLQSATVSKWWMVHIISLGIQRGRRHKKAQNTSVNLPTSILCCGFDWLNIDNQTPLVFLWSGAKPVSDRYHKIILLENDPILA